MKNFVAAMWEKANKSSTFIMTAYDDVSDYIVTDMSSTVFSRLLDDYGHYQLRNVYSLKGENVRGAQHYEYCVDEAALEELVLQLFFARKK